MSPHAMVTFIAAAKGHVWGRRPTVASVCVDVWVSGYPWRPCGFLRSGVMLVSKGHALPSGAMVTSRSGCCSELSGSAWLGSVLKWGICWYQRSHRNLVLGCGFVGVREPWSCQSHPDLSSRCYKLEPEFLSGPSGYQGLCSGLWLWLESVLMSRAYVTSGNHVWWNQRAMLIKYIFMKKLFSINKKNFILQKLFLSNTVAKSCTMQLLFAKFRGRLFNFEFYYRRAFWNYKQYIANLNYLGIFHGMWL